MWRKRLSPVPFGQEPLFSPNKAASRHWKQLFNEAFKLLCLLNYSGAEIILRTFNLSSPSQRALKFNVDWAPTLIRLCFFFNLQRRCDILHQASDIIFCPSGLGKKFSLCTDVVFIWFFVSSCSLSCPLSAASRLPENNTWRESDAPPCQRRRSPFSSGLNCNSHENKIKRNKDTETRRDVYLDSRQSPLSPERQRLLEAQRRHWASC